MQQLIEAAKKYKSNNISIIATDENKRALFPWKNYQSKIISDDDIIQQFSHVKCAGIAVICGKISRNLEVIDIDLKNDTTGKLYDNICDNIPENIFQKLRIIKTKSGGYHFYYRCKKIDGNQKFAMRSATPAELKDNPHCKQVVLIESRGEAGYVIAPPTLNYSLVQGADIQEITEGERAIILEIMRSFNEVVDEKIILPVQKIGYSKKPWDDYNERANCIDLLIKHGWKIVSQTGERIFLKRPGNTESKTSADFHTGLNLFKCFTTSSEFEAGRGYKPFGVYTLLEHKGDPSSAAKQLIKDGFGESAAPVADKAKKAIRALRDNGYNDDQIIDKLGRDLGISQGSAADTIKEYDQQAGDSIGTFWDVDEKGKITISRNKLERFLRNKGGFYLYFYNDGVGIYRLVQECNGLIEEVTIERIKKFVKRYIYSLEPSEPFDHGITVSNLMEVILKGSDAYFSKGLIEFLDDKKFDFFKDDSDTAYFTFRNGVVSITKDGIKLQSYKDINKVIWKSQVIDFDIAIDSSFDESLCEFAKFMNLVSGKEQDRYEYCKSIVGYLLHKHKNSSRPWSIILAEETDDEQKGGGTGKGILVKAISQMVKTERVDGKNFKLDKNFAFQRVGLDTKIVAIEDVRKNVDFEGFYSIITEGITVEKKNKDELFIAYNDSPKIIFTTNYTIPSVGVHAKRRQRVFEFASYFNGTYTPVDEFGHQLFDEWDEDEWNRFYNLMFACCSLYLKDGVKEVANSIKLKRKHIRINFSEEFLDYFDDLMASGGVSHVFNEEYNNFIKNNELEKKTYSAKRFKRAIIETSSLLDVKIETIRNRLAGNRTEFFFTGLPDTNKQKDDFIF